MNGEMGHTRNASIDSRKRHESNGNKARIIRRVMFKYNEGITFLK